MVHLEVKHIVLDSFELFGFSTNLKSLFIELNEKTQGDILFFFVVFEWTTQYNYYFVILKALTIGGSKFLENQTALAWNFLTCVILPVFV